MQIFHLWFNLVIKMYGEKITDVWGKQTEDVTVANYLYAVVLLLKS